MTKMVDVRKSDAFRRLLEVEKEAKTIFFNSPSFIPGVLQTSAYAQGIICRFSDLPASSPDDADIAERIEVRTARRTAFAERLQRVDAPEVHVVIDELVLLRGLGSDVMRGQIEHLIDISRVPTVHLGIIPTTYGFHPGQTGPWEVHDAADASLVFFEGPHGDQIIDDPTKVTQYRGMVKSLMGIAASGEAARTMMGKLVKS